MVQSGFSVCQFREDGSCQAVSRAVSLDEAVETFARQVCGGWTTRVLVTNGEISLEWRVATDFAGLSQAERKTHGTEESKKKEVDRGSQQH